LWNNYTVFCKKFIYVYAYYVAPAKQDLSRGMSVNRKNILLQTSSTSENVNTHKFPPPLEEATETELQRKAAISKITTSVLDFFSRQFMANGFEWLLPVVFSQSTDPLWPDQSASIEKHVEIEIYQRTLRPTTSMIVHKLVVCALVQPKLFILSPNVRIEKSDRATTGLHAYEFTQFDFEARDATSESIRRLIESVLSGLIVHLRTHLDDELFYLRDGHELPLLNTPFKIYDRKLLQDYYGASWEHRIICESCEPFWVTNFPREFYDFEDFETHQWDNYDLFLPGYGEVLSGARREFEHWKIVTKMDREGVRKDNYRVLLKLAEEGRLRPTAGAGIGLERIVSWLVKAKHVGETQLFPRIPGIIYEL
jgi:asparaginyl-tRNA synthetase